MGKGSTREQVLMKIFFTYLPHQLLGVLDGNKQITNISERIDLNSQNQGRGSFNHLVVQQRRTCRGWWMTSELLNSLPWVLCRQVLSIKDLVAEKIWNRKLS